MLRGLEPLQLELVLLGSELAELVPDPREERVVGEVGLHLGVKLGLARGDALELLEGPLGCDVPPPPDRAAAADCWRAARRSRYSSTPRGSIDTWPSPSSAHVESVTRSRK